MITDLFQKIPLDLIQLRLRVLGQHLEVVAEDHDGEDAASSEQHGDVAVKRVAEGQQDDIGFELFDLLIFRFRIMSLFTSVISSFSF